MKPMMTGFYVSNAKSLRNKKVWVLFNHHCDWDSSSMRNKGIMHGMVWQRPATPSEIDERNMSYRAVAYKYDDLDLLLEDEAASGASSVQIEQLRQVLLLKAKHVLVRRARQLDLPFSGEMTAHSQQQDSSEFNGEF